MRVLLVGAAVSGRAALRLLEREGHEVVVYDADPAAVAGPGGGPAGPGEAPGTRACWPAWIWW